MIEALKIPLLSDLNRTVSRDWAVLKEDVGFAMRATFIVDSKNNIRHLSVNDSAVGRSVTETLRLIHAFKHVDTHGDTVCPLDWTPGLSGIRTN